MTPPIEVVPCVSASKHSPLGTKAPDGDLVRSLEWWNSLALVLVQCVAHNFSVSQLDLPVRCLLPR